MVKNLSLGDLELILCDWYEMDEQLPNPIFEKKEFERVSNGLWAIGEFRNYVSKQIYPETQTSIKNLREMACYWLDFDNHKTTLEDGLECIIIDTMALSKFE